MNDHDCEPCGISRRAVIKGAGAATTVALALPAMGTSVAFASTNATRRGDVIVNVFLRGGMDGLSVVVPRVDAAGAGFYQAARPTLAVDPGAALPLNNDFGLHPAMSSLMPIWSRGDLALLPTCGFPINNRSHFTVQRQIDHGMGTTASSPNGWLARHLDLMPELDPVGVRAADMPRGQRSMYGSTVSITMGSVASFRVNGFTGSGGAAQAALRELHSVGSNVVTDRANQALEALDVVAAAPISPPANGAMYPSTGRGRRFGEHMRQIAQLIRADVGLEAAATQANLGWDSHANQGRFTDGSNRNSLEALAQVLAAFATDLGPLMDRVTVVLMTEFGRTFAENGNGGTDHGRASTAFVMGGGIRGGLYGDWPGLAPGDIDRNGLRVTVDYRYVLADIVEHRLGNMALDQVLPGFVLDPAQRLNLADPLPPVAETPAEPDPEEVVEIDEPEPAAEAIVVAPPIASSASYLWSSPDGASIRVDLPAPADDPTRVEIEAIRMALGEAPISYALALVDNSGASTATVAPVLVVSGEDGVLTYREAWVLADLWRRSATDVLLAQQAGELVTRLQATATVAPGSIAAVLLAAPGEQESILEVRLATPQGDVVLAPTAIDLTELVDATP